MSESMYTRRPSLQLPLSTLKEAIDEARFQNLSRNRRRRLLECNAPALLSAGRQAIRWHRQRSGLRLHRNLIYRVTVSVALGISGVPTTGFEAARELGSGRKYVFT